MTPFPLPRVGSAEPPGGKLGRAGDGGGGTPPEDAAQETPPAGFPDPSRYFPSQPLPGPGRGVLTDQIDPAALLAAFCAGREDVGGVVSFTGLVRRDDEVEALELEAYPALTEAEIARTMAQVRARHGLLDLLVRHRTGRMAPGEPIVFVAAAAAHRRAAFEAADQMMDYLKSRAPFWKKAHTRGGARWIEPRAQDYDDAARWDAPEETPA